MSFSLFNTLSTELSDSLSSDVSQSHAAVILLLSRGDNPALLFTKRALHLRNHPGEVCFPGGMREPGDVDLLATALREMEEEIGLPAHEVQVLGRLPEAHTRVGTRVTPFVASFDASYPLVAAISELDSIFMVPLSLFEQGIMVREDVFEREGRSYTIPVYHYQEYEIWGFTAAVTARFLCLITKANESKLINNS